MQLEIRDLLALVVSLASIFFGIGSWCMGALVTKNAIAKMETDRAKQRLEDQNSMRAWVEEHFARRTV